MLKRLFLKENIIGSLFLSLLFSSFIYLNLLNLDFKLLNSVIGLVVFYHLLGYKKEQFFWFGAFSGILWFWWLALPFYYWGLIYLAPFAIFGIALGYGVILYFLMFFNSMLLKALVLLIFSYVEPFAFNWFVPELIFTNSFFGVSKLDFGLILIGLLIFRLLDGYYKLFAIIPIIFALELRSYDIVMPKQKIKLTQTSFTQFQKWDKEMLDEMIKENFRLINSAIEDGFDIVVLPEGAFHIFLDEEINIFEKLKVKSHDIAIITGAFYSDGKEKYNSSYLFYKGSVILANKVVLAPFGERVPLPDFLRDLINELFYEGAKDFGKALTHTDFVINNESFRNAICYEATHERLFKGNPKYMIAISNNALFAPSIEPYLQRILMKFYAKKFKTIIFHSANYKFSGVITP